MFEQEAISYLNQLVIDGVMMDGNIIGVSEEQLTAKAISSFLINGIVKEKTIMIKKIDNVLSWYFLSEIDKNEVNRTEDDWVYPDYTKRIIAPAAMIMEDIGIKMFGWFQLNNLPVVVVNNTVYLYCNTILPEHSTVISSLEGLITIEDL